MKYLILLFCFLTNSSFSQENPLEDSVKKEINYKEEGYFDFSSNVLPNNPALAIVCAVKYNGEVSNDGFNCDLTLYLVDTKTQKIISQFKQEDKFQSDAYHLSYVKLDMANYKVTDNLRAFGIRVGFEGSSQVYPSWSNSLSLFVIQNNKISQILDMFPMDDLQGDWDTHCNYDGEKTESLAIMQSQKTNGYYDIAIKSTKTIGKTRAPKKESDPCIEMDKTLKPTTQILKFSNGSYKKTTSPKIKKK